MRRISVPCLIYALLLLGSCTPSGSKLLEGFTNPPAEARPRVWWHWEDGNVTKDGIRKDLDWMKRIGIGGFHHFDASIDMPPVVDERLIYMQEGWKDAFRYAIAYADSLGMEMGIASSPGWSSTGGPWVEKEDAMKQLVWTTTGTSRWSPSRFRQAQECDRLRVLGRSQQDLHP